MYSRKQCDTSRYIHHDGPDGVPLAIDIAILSPLRSVYVNAVHDLSMPAANVNTTERNKLRKYKEDFKSIKGRITFWGKFLNGPFFY
jgi:uncharacterized membrane protein